MKAVMNHEAAEMIRKILDYDSYHMSDDEAVVGQ